MLGLHRLQNIDPRAIVVHFSGVSLAVCVASLAVLPRTTTFDSHVDAAEIAMLLGVGTSATIGQLFLTKAFAAGPPAKVSVVAISQVGFAMLADILWWHREFNAITLVGIVLVMAPTAWLLASQGRIGTDDL